MTLMKGQLAGARRAQYESHGNCWDIAVAESFFSSLKKERIQKHICLSRGPALADISTSLRIYTTASGGIVTSVAARSDSSPLTNPSAALSTRDWELRLSA